MAGWRRKADARIARMARFVVRRPWWVIAGCMLAVVALTSQLPSVRFDTSTEGFLHDDDPALIDYNDFRDQFGSDVALVPSPKTDEGGVPYGHPPTIPRELRVDLRVPPSCLPIPTLSRSASSCVGPRSSLLCGSTWI